MGANYTVGNILLAFGITATLAACAQGDCPTGAYQCRSRSGCCSLTPFPHDPLTEYVAPGTRGGTVYELPVYVDPSYVRANQQCPVDYYPARRSNYEKTCCPYGSQLTEVKYGRNGRVEVCAIQ